MKYDFLISKLRSLVTSERKITAEIIEVIKEIDHKRIYLDYSHTSMFSFLTVEIGYSASAAMRRIDAARLTKEIPELRESLKTGEINLSQVSMLSQAIRQKQKDYKVQSIKAEVSKETKVLLLEQVKSLDLAATQKSIAKGLDLDIRGYEKKSYQKDESVRLEMTLTKQQFENLNRVKELISHQNPNPTLAELVDFLSNHFLDKKDPLRQKVLVRRVDEVNNDSEVRKFERKNSDNRNSGRGGLEKNCQKEQTVECKESAYAATVVRTHQAQLIGKKPVPLKTKQMIFKRDQSCRWETKVRNQQGEIVTKKCQSKFQLQIDHKVPRWQDGKSNQENLQVLCATHNKLKYQYEMVGKL